MRNHKATCIALGCFIFVLGGISDASQGPENEGAQELTPVKANSHAPQQDPKVNPRGGPGQLIIPAAVKPVETVGSIGRSGSLLKKGTFPEISPQKPVHGANFKHEEAGVTRSDQNVKQGALSAPDVVERGNRAIVKAPEGNSPDIRRSEKVPTLDHEEINSARISRSDATPKRGLNSSTANIPSISSSGKIPIEVPGQGKKDNSENSKPVVRSDHNPRELPLTTSKPLGRVDIIPSLNRPVQAPSASRAAGSRASEPVLSDQKPTQTPPPLH